MWVVFSQLRSVALPRASSMGENELALEKRVLFQRTVGQHIIKHLPILDRWSCLQVFPTWRGLVETPVILAQGSEENRSKITKQLVHSEEETILIIRDNRGLDLFRNILQTHPILEFHSFNIVSLDLRDCIIPIDELNDLLSGANSQALFNLQSLSASLKQVRGFVGDCYANWRGNTPVLTEPIQTLPRLKRLDVLIIPNLTVNSTPLAKLLWLCLNASEFILRDMNASAPWGPNVLFPWYSRHNFPSQYPNLKALSVSAYSEFLSVMLMASKGDYKIWYPKLEKLTIFAQCNYMVRQDLEEYRRIFHDIPVGVPPYTRFLDGPTGRLY
nr:expressed conserved protein [Hymenolepis microstoma]